MDPVEVLQATLVEARALARIAERTAVAARARAKVRARNLESRVDSLNAVAADVRLRVSVSRWVPLGFLWRRSLETRASFVASELSEARELLASEPARIQRLGKLADKAADAQAKVARAQGAIDVLGYPPKDIVTRASRALAKAVLLRKLPQKGDDPGAKWAYEAVLLVGEMSGVIRDWARARALVDNRRRAEEARQAAGAATPQPRRVYLPIPRTLDGAARDAGALRDASAPQGASPWFVTHDMGLSKFRHLLPLAARPSPAGLSFPPVPMTAAGQNLWGMFDKATWDHVRRQAYATTGRRCVICGGRSQGFLSDKLYTHEEKAHPVECHEVWDWKVPVEADGIGIQTLKQLLVVCRSCHPMFHSSFFMKRAREAGIEADVAAAIEKRRMLVNRENRDTIAAGIERQAENLRRASGVDRWIVDLSHLGHQAFMAHRPAVMLEDNPAALPPERIAGIAFETDSGRSFQARGAEQIRAEILDPVRRTGADVIAFTRR